MLSSIYFSIWLWLFLVECILTWRYFILYHVFIITDFNLMQKLMNFLSYCYICILFCFIRFLCVLQNESFQCTSGHCIAPYLRCDGARDCRDMSDEINCPPRYPGGRYCPHSRFQCNNNLCVSLSDICDGTDDCGDNSDENPTMCGEFITTYIHYERT